jgi:hypothetical protein
MGQEIVYCFKCLTRLTGQDLDRGKGRRFGNRVACAACLPELLASATPEEIEAERPPSRVREPSRRPSSSTTHHPVPSSTPRSFRAPAGGAKLGPWIAGGVGAFLLLLLFGMAMSGGRATSATASKEPASTSPPTPPPPKADPRIKAARDALVRARAVELATPGNLDAIVAAYEEAMKKADETELFTDAVRAYDAAVARRKEARMKADLDVDREIRDAIAREDFSAARSAAEKKPGTDWPARLREAAEALRDQVRVKMADARRRNDEKELAELRDRVGRWGYPELLASLEEVESWRAVFDGRTTSCLISGLAGGWKVENGALVPAGEKIQPTKSSEEFGDVDLRIRLEFADASNLCLWGRQTGEGAVGFEWGRDRLNPLRGAPHEFILSLRQDRVAVTLDGVPVPGETRGRVVKGPFQISGIGRGLRILSIHVRPALQEPSGAWRPLFDGRTTDFVLPEGAAGWKVEGGALVPLATAASAIKSREEFGDVDLRFRFEFAESSYLVFWGRQGPAGALGVEWDRSRLEALRGAPHEILLRLRGETATVTLDGLPASGSSRGRILKGPIQIVVVGKGYRITAVDVRVPAPEQVGDWRTIFDGRSMDWMGASSRRFWAVDGEGIMPVPLKKGETRDSIQTRESFGDGDLRVVFDTTGPLDSVSVALRQSGSGRALVRIDGERLSRLPAGRHEILVSCRGSQLSGTVDGASWPVPVEGQPEAKGRVQFIVNGDHLRLVSVAWRDAR